MKTRISRRGAFVTVVAAALAPLVGKLRLAFAGSGRADAGPSAAARPAADDRDADRQGAVTTHCYDETARLISVVGAAETVETTFVYEG